MGAVVGFLQMMAQLVIAKHGGHANDIAKLLKWGAAGIRAKGTVEKGLEAANEKVKQLVLEDRSLNSQENAQLDAEIEAQLADAASIDVRGGSTTDDPPIG